MFHATGRNLAGVVAYEAAVSVLEDLEEEFSSAEAYDLADQDVEVESQMACV